VGSIEGAGVPAVQRRRDCTAPVKRFRIQAGRAPLRGSRLRLEHDAYHGVPLEFWSNPLT
jgi:hypothetical protein